jgi:YesN/AraC family two-component response regulator
MGNKEGFEAVQRMQNYIAEHIHEPITLRALAQGYRGYIEARPVREIKQ